MTDLTKSLLLLPLIVGLGFICGCDRNSARQESAALPAKAKLNDAPAAQAGTASADTPLTNLVLIPAGQFVMGDKEEPDAQPHPVKVSSFYIDKFLVTQAEYQRTVNSNPSRWKNDKHPVEQVRWSDAARFCNKRSEQEGLEPCYDLETWKCNYDASGYRLPTEAEWEYACRAGTSTPYFFGDSAAKLGDAWFEKNSGGHPQPVGLKRANPWGLFDMCGNVWQWCNDFYKVDHYSEAAALDPRGPAEGDTKVVRGGAWRSAAENCRSGYRYNESPGYADVCFGYDIYGFRCVRKASSAPKLANGR